MFDLRNFVIEGHEKIIGHYRRLLESSTSEPERERFRRCIEEELEALNRFLEQAPRSKRAAYAPRVAQ
jgi:hypothetical protein